MAKTYRITIEYTTTNPMEFGVNRREARTIVSDWMSWVSENPSNRDL